MKGKKSIIFKDQGECQNSENVISWILQFLRLFLVVDSLSPTEFSLRMPWCSISTHIRFSGIKFLSLLKLCAIAHALEAPLK